MPPLAGDEADPVHRDEVAVALAQRVDRDQGSSCPVPTLDPGARVQGRRSRISREMAILRPRCRGVTAVLRLAAWEAGSRSRPSGGPSRTCPADAASWGSSHYRERVRRWQEARARLQDPGVDRTLLDIWLRERARAFAIETGQIEGALHAAARGDRTTDRRGLRGECAPSTPLEPGLSDRTLKGLLEDQHAAVELVFEGRRRPPSVVPPHDEELAPASDPPPGARGGHSRRQARGHPPASRRLQDSGRTTRGGRTASSTSTARPSRPAARWIGCSRCTTAHADRRLPAEVEAAWLHHRLVRIHPFQDGNGRMARLLMAYVFARAGEFHPSLRQSCVTTTS